MLNLKRSCRGCAVLFGRVFLRMRKERQNLRPVMEMHETKKWLKKKKDKVQKKV